MTSESQKRALTKYREKNRELINARCLKIMNNRYKNDVEYVKKQKETKTLRYHSNIEYAKRQKEYVNKYYHYNQELKRLRNILINDFDN